MNNEDLKEQAAITALEYSQLKNPHHNLIYIEGTSYKFYQVKEDGLTSEVITCYGKIGTAGNYSKVKSTYPAATIYKIVNSKLKKGYEEPILKAKSKPSKKTKAAKPLTSEAADKLEAFLTLLK